MTHHNVVPFDPRRRAGWARRGAADKSERSPQSVILECPSCAAELRLEAAWLEDETDLLCGRCETEISLAPPREGVR